METSYVRSEKRTTNPTQPKACPVKEDSCKYWTWPSPSVPTPAISQWHFLPWPKEGHHAAHCLPSPKAKPSAATLLWVWGRDMEPRSSREVAGGSHGRQEHSRAEGPNPALSPASLDAPQQQNQVHPAGLSSVQWVPTALSNHSSQTQLQAAFQPLSQSCISKAYFHENVSSD